MNRAFRKLNLKIAPILFIPLLITAVTGIALGLGDRFGGLPSTVNNALKMIHQGEFIGRKLVPFYVLLLGLGVFAIGLTTLIKSRDSLMHQKAQPNTVSIYKILALILVFPLAVCVQTGIAYRLGTDWLNMPNDRTAVFQSMHTGASLGIILGIFYTFVTGLSLIALSITGIKMTPLGKTAFPENKTKLSSSQVRQSSQNSLPLLDNVLLLKKKIRNAIIIFSIVFTVILWFVTKRILLPIGIVGIVFTVPAWIVAERLIRDWQRQKKFQANFYDRESESATILRAIPDSMLRMTQDGICLSYIPAKEATPFVIRGEIINKRVTEFLAPKIASEFTKSAHLSLETGLTHFCRFSIPLDNGGRKYYEARFSAIGATEVLIMIRESDFDETTISPEQPSNSSTDDSIRLLDEPELVQILEVTLEKIQQDDRHHILCCLAIDEIEPNLEVDSHEQQDSHLGDILIYQIASKMMFHLSSDYVARLNDNELVMLVLNCSLERASELVDELQHELNNFLFQWQNHEDSINASIGLLEINADSPNTADLINVAKATCNMAKQKVDVKTFW